MTARSDRPARSRAVAAPAAAARAALSDTAAVEWPRRLLREPLPEAPRRRPGDVIRTSE
jgi:hypothetical protein